LAGEEWKNWMMRQFDNSTIQQFDDLNNGMLRLLPKFRFGGRKVEEWENVQFRIQNVECRM
jgi:hypothetical protein